MAATTKNGSGYYTGDAEYVASVRYGRDIVIRGDGSWTEVDDADTTADRLASGELSDSAFEWVD